jgi:protein-L-isoaspartate(D-aspartate) O-methyltransferase
MNHEIAREQMVARHLRLRGITDPLVLEAFRTVPREAFLPPELAEFAYEDSALPIEEGQTISQPYIVAVTVQALGLTGGERVLEIGAGSGYAAAVLGQVAGQVYTVERIQSLAERAAENLQRAGCHNVHVACHDGTLGWPEHAPYDAIAVAAGGPEVPRALLSQLTIGGRLVIPVGSNTSSQVLIRVVREGEDDYREEPLTGVRFVPLIGAQGWSAPGSQTPAELSGGSPPAAVLGSRGPITSLAKLVREAADPIDAVDVGVDAFLERVGDARLVLLGESTHGTSEFYEMRARISRALIERHGFGFVAVEADWPDAARVDTYVLGDPARPRPDFEPFSRFPTWMWRNREVDAFVGWLRGHNLQEPERDRRVGFHGLDLYSLFTSIDAVLTYLDDVDPDAAGVARARYGLLTPWQSDPASYGRAVLSGRYESAQDSVVATLVDMLRRRLDYADRDGERFFDAAQNARVVANAERYYRAMYYGSRESWNLRDRHMFDTLSSLLAFYGPESRGIVWEHNSHVGDARATEMGVRGELNVGQLSREAFGEAAYLVGFSTDHGTVAAASDWGGPMEIKRVRPALEGSYERVFHESGVPAFFLHLRDPRRREVRDELRDPRLERAIGVIYRPETERHSHYFQAVLPEQFDEVVWFDETSAVTPLGSTRPVSGGAHDTYPFGV